MRRILRSTTVPTAPDLGVDEAIAAMSALARIELPYCVEEPPSRWRILVGRIAVRLRMRRFRGADEEAAAREFSEDVLPGDHAGDLGVEGPSLYEERLHAVAASVEKRAAAISEIATGVLATLRERLSEAVVEGQAAEEARVAAERAVEESQAQSNPDDDLPRWYYDDSGRARRTPPKRHYRAKIAAGVAGVLAMLLAELRVTTQLAIEVLWVDVESPVGMAAAYALACGLTGILARLCHTTQHGTTTRTRAMAGAAFLAMATMIAGARGSLGSPVVSDLLPEAAVQPPAIEPLLWLVCIAVPGALSLCASLVSAGMRERSALHSEVRASIAAAARHARLEEKLLSAIGKATGWEALRAALEVSIALVERTRAETQIRLREAASGMVLTIQGNHRRRNAQAAATRRLARSAAPRRQGNWNAAAAGAAVGVLLSLLAPWVSQAQAAGETPVHTHILCVSEDRDCINTVLSRLAEEHLLLPGAGQICVSRIDPTRRAADLIGCLAVDHDPKTLTQFGRQRSQAIANYRRAFREAFTWQGLAARKEELPGNASRVAVPLLGVTIEDQNCTDGRAKAHLIVCDTSNSSDSGCRDDVLKSIFRSWARESCPRTYTVVAPASGAPSPDRWIDIAVATDAPLLERVESVLLGHLDFAAKLAPPRQESGSDLATAISSLAPLLEPGINTTIWLLSDGLQQAVKGADWYRDPPRRLALVQPPDGTSATIRICQPSAATRISPALRTAISSAWRESFLQSWNTKVADLQFPGRCP